MADSLRQTGYAFAPLPELFKALESCNTSPYTLVGVLCMWERLIICLHVNYERLQHPLPTTSARQIWETVSRYSCDPFGSEYRDPYSHQVLQNLSRQNWVLIIREVELIHSKIQEHPDTDLRDPSIIYPGDRTLSGQNRDPSIAKFFILSCIANHAPGLPLQTEQWLTMIWEAQPSPVRPPDFPIYDGSIAPILRFFGLTIHENGHFVHFLKLFLRFAMAVSDIWTTSLQHNEYDRTAHLPGYKWYILGVTHTITLLHREVEDPFSHYPRAVREAVPNLNWVRCYDEIWKIAQEARTQEVDADQGVSLRQAVYTTWIRNLSRQVDYESSPNALQIRDALGWHAEGDQFVLYDTYALLSEEPMADWTIVNNVRDVNGTFRGLGSMFYGNQLVGSSGDRFTMVLNNVGTIGLQDARLEAYGPRHLLVNFTLPKPASVEGECCICQEDFTTLSSDSQQAVSVQSCLHLFHAECLDDWVNGTAANSHLCPVCRQPMVANKRPVRPVDENRIDDV